MADTPFYERIPESSTSFRRLPYYIARADRKKCPVCGHPTGDCTDTYEGPRVVLGGTDNEVKVYVEEDITEEVELPGGTRTKILKARKGSYITQAKAKELGIS